MNADERRFYRRKLRPRLRLRRSGSSVVKNLLRITRFLPIVVRMALMTKQMLSEMSDCHDCSAKERKSFHRFSQGFVSTHGVQQIRCGTCSGLHMAGLAMRP